MKITAGRYSATIRPNGDRFLVIVTRDGDCLHGIPSRSYKSLKSANTGAEKLLKKAAA